MWPSSSISHTIENAKRGSPGCREHSCSHSSRGSIGITRCTRYLPPGNRHTTKIMSLHHGEGTSTIASSLYRPKTIHLLCSAQGKGEAEQAHTLHQHRHHTCHQPCAITISLTAHNTSGEGHCCWCSACCSVGKLARGSHTLVPRTCASSSRAVPGRTKLATSAMWTPIRQRLPGSACTRKVVNSTAVTAQLLRASGVQSLLTSHVSSL